MECVRCKKNKGEIRDFWPYLILCVTCRDEICNDWHKRNIVNENIKASEITKGDLEWLDRGYTMHLVGSRRIAWSALPQ